VLGSVAALKLVRTIEPLKLASAALILLTLPLGLLVFELPKLGVIAVLVASSFFGPLINAPMLGVITTRSPEALRVKVMTAVLTVALLAGPVGLLAAGPLLEELGPHAVFGIVAGGQLVAAVAFAAIALRYAGGRAGPPEVVEA